MHVASTQNQGATLTAKRNVSTTVRGNDEKTMTKIARNFAACVPGRKARNEIGAEKMT
jgi:hypothetical protein